MTDERDDYAFLCAALVSFFYWVERTSTNDPTRLAIYMAAIYVLMPSAMRNLRNFWRDKP